MLRPEGQKFARNDVRDDEWSLQEAAMRPCDSGDLDTIVQSCHSDKQFVSFGWQPGLNCTAATNIFPLPTPYTGIPCGNVGTSSITGILTITYAAIITTLGLVFLLWLHFYQRLPVVKNSNGGKLMYFCISGMLLQLSWISFLGDSISPGRCMARPWLLALTFSLYVSTLMRRMYSKRAIIIHELEAQRQRYRQLSFAIPMQPPWAVCCPSFIEQYPAVIVLLSISVDVVICLIWTLQDPSIPSGKSFIVPGYDTTVHIENYVCRSSGSRVYILLLVVFKCLQTGAAATLAFRLYLIAKKKRDPIMMLYTMYAVIVCGALMLIMTTMVPNLSPAAFLFIGGTISLLAVGFAFSALFLPKMYHHWVIFTMRKVLPIHVALLNGEEAESVLRMLQEEDCAQTVRYKDGDDRTALAIAVEAGASNEVVSELLKHSLPFDPVSEEPVCADDHDYAWTRMVQQDRYSLVVRGVLQSLPNLALKLARVQDASGRATVDIATPECKRVILQEVYYFRRYDITTLDRPLRKTNSCIVHSAYDREDQDRKVVLKMLHNEDNFTREVESRSKGNLSETFVVGIIRYHSSYDDEGYRTECNRKGFADYPFCIVMVAGDYDLLQIIAQESFDWDRVRSVSVRVAQCLQHLHHAGYVHGDITPSNIVRFNQELKLIDLDASIRYINTTTSVRSLKPIGHNYSTGYIPPEFLCGSGAQLCTRSPFDSLKRPDRLRQQCTQLTSISPIRSHLLARSNNDNRRPLSLNHITDFSLQRPTFSMFPTTGGRAAAGGAGGGSRYGDDEYTLLHHGNAGDDDGDGNHHRHDETKSWDGASGGASGGAVAYRGALTGGRYNNDTPLTAAEASEDDFGQQPYTSLLRPFRTPRTPWRGSWGTSATPRDRIQPPSRTRHVPIDALPADPSFDMWSLGMTLFSMIIGGHPLGCDGEGNLVDESDLIIIAEWPEDYKHQKLSKIAEPYARNLVSLLLSKQPEKRPTIDAVMVHPFLTGRIAPRLPNDPPEYDAFISYRVASDLPIAAQLHHRLTEAGIRTWWDKACLQPGEPWEKSFCLGLIKSAIFIPLISREGINSRSNVSQDFRSLSEESPCDNLLLEYRLAIELSERGLIEKIFPIFIGDVVSLSRRSLQSEEEEEEEEKEKEEEEEEEEEEQQEQKQGQEQVAERVLGGEPTGFGVNLEAGAGAGAGEGVKVVAGEGVDADIKTEERGNMGTEVVESSEDKNPQQLQFNKFTFRGVDACLPDCIPDIIVSRVEAKLREKLDTQGLGCPLLDTMTVADILSIITSYQGAFVEGDLQESMYDIVGLIEQMRHTLSYATVGPPSQRSYSHGSP